MYVLQGQKSSSSAPEPDLDSGAMALQTTAVTTPASVSPRPTAAMKVKPSVPQKKDHMDEMYRLRKEKDDAIKMKNMMEDELLQTQDELQEKDDEVERLYKQIQELNAKLAERDARLKQSAASNSRDSATPRSRLDVTAKAKIEQLRAQLEEAQKEKFAAQAELKIAQESFEDRLLEAQHSADAQLEAVQKRAQSSENALSEQMGRMDIDAGNRQEHAQTIAKLEDEIQDQRERCEQFRRTCERLTTQIKQVNDSNAGLARSEREAQRRMEDMKSRITGLEARLRDTQMPGSYYRDS